jgi:hypothetical protein
VIHRQELARARHHLGSLAHEVREYLDSKPYRLTHQYDRRAGQYLVRVQVERRAPATIPSAVADVVRLARAALDALLIASGSPPSGKAPRFPIHDSVHTFAQRARRAIAHLSAEAQADIEAMQPYHRGDLMTSHPLWLLTAIGDVDEQRMLAAGTVLAGTRGGVNTIRHVELLGEFEGTPGVFDDGAVIASVRVNVVGPDPKLDMHLQPAFDVAFARTGPVRGRPVVETLSAMLDHVEQEIVVPLERHLTLR